MIDTAILWAVVLVVLCGGVGSIVLYHTGRFYLVSIPWFIRSLLGYDYLKVVSDSELLVPHLYVFEKGKKEETVALQKIGNDKIVIIRDPTWKVCYDIGELDNFVDVTAIVANNYVKVNTFDHNKKEEWGNDSEEDQK